MAQNSVTHPKISSHQAGAIFDMERLAAIEAMCRTCISQEPENMSARLRLAWCLMVQAFHEAGQEAALKQICDTSTTNDPPETAPETIVEGGNANKSTANQLLRGCLKQTMMVTQLSTNPNERNEAESLQRLVTMSGGQQAMMEAGEESSHIFAEVAKALMQTFDDEQKKSRGFSTSGLTT